ncbi:MAG: PD40 domain-containing protein [Bacteroidetes bacterium]|nr:PD40 domain-containing protein [Bacteroidota bacterium]
MKYIFAGLLIFIGIGSAVSQSKNATEDKAYEALNNEDYVKAYELFTKLHKQSPSNEDYELKLGIACLGYPGKTEEAIGIFQKLSSKSKTHDAEFYLGKAYHINYKFDEAVRVLLPLTEVLADSKKKEEKKMLANAKLIIRQCVNAKEITKTPNELDVTNMGSPVNTNELESTPAISSDESMMIFTYQGRKSVGGKMDDALQYDPNGVYTTDIYMSLRLNDSVWGVPVPIKTLNTKANDAAIALSPNGRTLFTFMSNNENSGDIYVSYFNGKEFSKATPLNSNINSQSWEGSCSISADGKLLYFSSERPGGFGGRDIWVSELVKGDWGAAKNLGETINTPYDDDAPFIHPDGVTLFFSSKGHNSIGGYDIMFTTKQPDGTWSEPTNMGVPVNTTEDDRYYVINSKGSRGYFSSSRAGKGSFGSQDIYSVNPGIFGDPLIISLHKGIVYGNGTPVEAKIEITNLLTNESLYEFYSNNNSGKYLVTLKPGAKYRVKISSEGYEPYEADVDLQTLTEFSERKKDVHLFSKEFAAANPETVKQKQEEMAKADEEFLEESRKLTESRRLQAERQKEEVSQKSDVISQKSADVSQQTERAKNSEPQTKPQETKEEESHKSEVGSKQSKTAKEETSEKLQVVNQNTKTQNSSEPKTTQQKTTTEDENRQSENINQQSETPEEETSGKSQVASQKSANVNQQNETEKNSEPETKQQETGKKVTIPCSGNVPDFSNIKGKSLNEPEVYKELMKIAGNFCGEGIVFKVQIGAYRNPENFKYINLKNLGEVETIAGDDGITRFTQKQFNVVKDAEKHRQKAIAKGQKDAWIVVFVNGQRYTLEDFIMADFLSKPVN